MVLVGSTLVRYQNGKVLHYTSMYEHKLQNKEHILILLDTF